MSRDKAPTEKQSEAELERQVLIAVGRIPDLLIRKNEVGQFFKPTIIPALRAVLAEFGHDAVRAALDALTHHRCVVGLGVGSPDLVLSFRGRAAGWELKTATGVVSEDQERFHNAARARGMTIEVVRSVEDGWSALERMGHRR